MPQLDGIEATRRILAACEQSEDLRIIILTTFDLDRYVYDALAAGASGFLLKDVTPEHLVAAVHWCAPATRCSRPPITRRLVERFTPRATAADPTAPRSSCGDVSSLTPRELEVLGFIARGMSNAEITAALTLSEATV